MCCTVSKWSLLDVKLVLLTLNVFHAMSCHRWLEQKKKERVCYTTFCFSAVVVIPIDLRNEEGMIGEWFILGSWLHGIYARNQLMIIWIPCDQANVIFGIQRKPADRFSWVLLCSVVPTFGYGTLYQLLRSRTIFGIVLVQVQSTVERDLLQLDLILLFSQMKNP